MLENRGSGFDTRWILRDFPIFVHNRSFLDILQNFNLLRTLELAVFKPLFPRIYGRHYFSLFQIMVENLIKWRHFLKNTARLEIIITINVENWTNIWGKVFVIFYANCSTNCYYTDFNPGGIFEKMTSFSPILSQDLEQGKLMAAANLRK